MEKFRKHNMTKAPSGRWGQTMDIQEGYAVYYRMREKQERDRAAGASHGGARIIHQTMAEEYRVLAEEAERGEVCSIGRVALRSSLTSPFI